MIGKVQEMPLPCLQWLRLVYALTCRTCQIRSQAFVCNSTESLDDTCDAQSSTNNTCKVRKVWGITRVLGCYRLCWQTAGLSHFTWNSHRRPSSAGPGCLARARPPSCCSGRRLCMRAAAQSLLRVSRTVGDRPRGLPSCS